MITVTTGSSTPLVTTVSNASDGVFCEKARRLCGEMVASCPDGNIPIQTVYEMLLRMVNLDYIVEAMRADGDIGEIDPQ